MESFKLRINPRKCTLCGLCSQVCSEHHVGKIDPKIWTIKVIETPNGRKIPKSCVFCGQCITACPVGAIKFQSIHNIMMISVDKELCDFCGGKIPKCVQVCPSEVIKMSSANSTPLLCDFCGGQPICADNCPSSAISLRPLDEPTRSYLTKLSQK